MEESNMLLASKDLISVQRLLLALLAGGIIGYERSAKNIDAGFRTHILVCMSSCAIMLTSLHMYAIYGAGDPMRMPAQVISGVGFLGAGCILVTRQIRIKGITTAAGLWAASCLGLCIGAGDYTVAVFVMAGALLSLTLFRVVDNIVLKRKKNIRFYIEIESPAVLTDIIKDMFRKGIKVTDVERIEDVTGRNSSVVMSLNLRKAVLPKDVISDLNEKDGIVYISEL
ncbi:MAG: MgtC/SapB family protein [Lachnospiraceae bacterium]|nr:MgtC/SapB family protein [Lachnospiraceae bacterium]